MNLKMFKAVFGAFAMVGILRSVGNGMEGNYIMAGVMGAMAVLCIINFMEVIRLEREQ